MNQIETEILKKAKDSKINCAMALAIARDLEVPPKDVGKAIDGLGIRICKLPAPKVAGVCCQGWKFTQGPCT